MTISWAFPPGEIGRTGWMCATAFWVTDSICFSSRNCEFQRIHKLYSGKVFFFPPVLTRDARAWSCSACELFAFLSCLSPIWPAAWREASLCHIFWLIYLTHLIPAYLTYGRTKMFKYHPFLSVKIMQLFSSIKKKTPWFRNIAA